MKKSGSSLNIVTRAARNPSESLSALKLCCWLKHFWPVLGSSAIQCSNTTHRLQTTAINIFRDLLDIFFPSQPIVHRLSFFTSSVQRTRTYLPSNQFQFFFFSPSQVIINSLSPPICFFSNILSSPLFQEWLDL